MNLNDIYISNNDEQDLILEPINAWYLRPDPPFGAKQAYGAVTYLDLVLGSADIGEQSSVSAEVETPQVEEVKKSIPGDKTEVLLHTAVNIEKIRLALQTVCALLIFLIAVIAFK